jgi:hypothetical protein
MEADTVHHLVTKLTLSVRMVVWIRETGSGPPTHVRANSEPAASRAPPKALASPAGLCRARLMVPHTQTSLSHWNLSLAEPDSYVYGHLKAFGRSGEMDRDYSRHLAQRLFGLMLYPTGQ